MLWNKGSINFLGLSLLLFLAVIAILLWKTFPLPNEYHLGADEGTYYRQGKVLVEQGFSGYNFLAQQYIDNPDLRLGPSPLSRFGHIFVSSVCVRINDSVESLSVLSLIAFVLLVIVGYFYASEFWGQQIAALFSLLLATSPLSLGMAQRALMDSELHLFSMVTILSFLAYLVKPARQRFAFFCCVLTFSCLLKDGQFLYLPFWLIAMLILKRFTDVKLSFRQIVLAMAIPVIVCVTLFLFAFHGIDRIILLIKLFLATPNSYGVWLQGPWYTPILHHLALSPVETLLGIGFVGYYLVSNKKEILTTVAIAYCGYQLLLYAFLIKSARYTMDFDSFLRLFTVMFLVALSQKLPWSEQVRKYVVVGAVLALMVLDFFSFQTYFMKEHIYDPISFNLLQSVQIIPHP